MDNKEIPKAYEPQAFEDNIYSRWEKSGFFNPDNFSIKNKKHQPEALPPPAEKTENSSWQRLLPKFLQTTNYKLQASDYFSIVMPPPNVTGTLHIGHAVMLAIQDIMVRFARMRGKKTLWVPGTDHAAIATQSVVEKKLIKEGMKDPRRTLGREKFLAEVEKFANASHDRIVTQIRKMGASCDWSREAFTLDGKRSFAVRTMFKMMYDDGLIYRGNRIVNWCPRCGSTLADDEVEYRDQKTKFYYLKYGPVVIGTARPETKFLDKILVVHPDDERYKNLHGKEFEIEWIEGKIKARVIADAVIDKDFGTGAMTITPAHSFEDFDLAKKYDLPIEKIIGEDGNFTSAAGSFAGKNALQSRNEIVEILKNKGLVDHIDDNYEHRLSVCYRCETPVEPLPKLQWFIDVNKKVRGETLKERMRNVVSSGQVKILPERFKKVYYHWIDNLRDWCISRQIWYGHRIPVWYCVKFQAPSTKSQTITKSQIQNSKQECVPVVAMEQPEKCLTCGGKELIQDEDTLDTWFSAGLWTFSALGWPTNCGQTGNGVLVKNGVVPWVPTQYDIKPPEGIENIKAGACRVQGDLQKFHPTSVLETGYDILFFWIARMIMMTTYALDQVPFNTVYLHGLVRDETGRKMSKSLGNVIDPLDMTEKYGADATRLALIIGAGPGNDVKLSEEKIAGYRNFTNKLWNISRYILGVIGEIPAPKNSPEGITLADKWILQELDRVIGAVTEHLIKYEFTLAGELLRDFTWSSLADWYLEISKIQIASSTPQVAQNTKLILAYCLRNILKLWHPFTPFVTEVIWESSSKNENPENKKEFLMIESWPEHGLSMNKEVLERFEILQKIISAIRNLRAEYKIEMTKMLDVKISAGKEASWILDQGEVIKKLARASKLEVFEKIEKTGVEAGTAVGAIEVLISLEGLVDLEKEKQRIEKDLAEAQKYAASIKNKLESDFVKKAPKEVVDRERARLVETEEKIIKLKARQNSLPRQ